MLLLMLLKLFSISVSFVYFEPSDSSTAYVTVVLTVNDVGSELQIIAIVVVEYLVLK